MTSGTPTVVLVLVHGAFAGSSITEPRDGPPHGFRQQPAGGRMEVVRIAAGAPRRAWDGRRPGDHRARRAA